jgi:hypothetical protein
LKFEEFKNLGRDIKIYSDCRLAPAEAPATVESAKKNPQLPLITSIADFILYHFLLDRPFSFSHATAH